MSESSPAAPTLPRTAAQRALLFFGSLGPLGHLPASGTCTVLLVAVPLVWLSGRLSLPVWLYFAGALVWTGLAVAVHQAGDRILGEKDSRKLVLDEVAGYLVAMIGVSPTWEFLALAFVIERVTDILKVWPANWVERNLPGGWGVVGDDVVAGAYTLAILHGLRFSGWL